MLKSDLDTSSVLQYSQSGPERVKVSVRLRPFIDEEMNGKDRQVCIEHMDLERSLIIVKKDFEKRQFQFDTLFDPKSSQIQIYQRVAKPVIESVVRGVNGTIFCYGQTGTGKTYTMMGNPDSEERGIIPRALEQVFQDIAKDAKHSYQVQISYMQIYMEDLLDLINPENTEVRIRECPDSGVFVAGLEWVAVDGPLECLRVVGHAEKNRVIAFTNLNAHSSRSHSIMMVRVERRNRSLTSSSNSTNDKSCGASRNIPQRLQLSQSQSNTSVASKQQRPLRSMGVSQEYYEDFHQQQKYFEYLTTRSYEDAPFQELSSAILSATLYLVDLAGSERVKKSRATGDRLSEARFINSSLTALGKCIHALTDPKTTFVPFRDSKLTRILQDALGGNCKTALVVNIGPAMKHAEETLSSLSFGMRAMKVQNMPIVNLIGGGNIKEQLGEESKQEVITRLQSSQHRLVQQVQMLEKEVQDLKQGQLSQSYDLGMEAQYKAQIQRMEEDHKKFLEEIDTMMVDQEQENDQLRKQLQDNMQRLAHVQDESEHSKHELMSVIQELQQMLAQRDGEMNDAKELMMQLQRENQDIAEDCYRQQQLLKDNSQRALATQEALRQSKERHLSEFRQETEQLSAKYAKLVEDKRRLEQEVDPSKTNVMQNEITQLRSQVAEMQVSLNEKQVLMMTRDSELESLREGEKKLRRQLDEVRSRFSEFMTQHEQELGNQNRLFTRDRNNLQCELGTCKQHLTEVGDELKETNLLLQNTVEELNRIAEERDVAVNAMAEVTKRMESQDEKLRKQRENFDSLIAQKTNELQKIKMNSVPQGEFESLRSKLLEEKKQIEESYAAQCNDLQEQLELISAQFSEIKKFSDAQVEQLRVRDKQVADLRGQVQKLTNAEQTANTRITQLVEVNTDLERQIIQQQEQVFEYQQQVTAMKGSLLKGDIDHLQTVITDLEGQKNSLQLYIQHQRGKHIDKTEEQNFQVLEMKRSIALTLQDGQMVLDLQTRIDELQVVHEQELERRDTTIEQQRARIVLLVTEQDQLSKELEEKLSIIEEVCGTFRAERDRWAQEQLSKEQTIARFTSLLTDQEQQVVQQAQLINHQQEKLYEQYELVERLNTDLRFLQTRVEQQSQQLSCLQAKSQRAVQKMEDVMVNEVIKGVLEKVVMQVEYNLLDVEDSVPSQFFFTCQTPQHVGKATCWTATAPKAVYSIRSLSSSLAESEPQQRDSLTKNLHQQLVESLFIEEDEEEEQDSQQVCSQANMAIIEQSDEDSGDERVRTPALRGSGERQYQTEPNDQKSAFQLPQFFMRSSFKHNLAESDLLNQLVSLAQSNQHFQLTQSKYRKANDYSFSATSFQAEDPVSEVKSVLERVLFVVEANAEFCQDQLSLSMIRYSNPPSEIVSMKSSLVNDVSFQNEPAVEKFMSRVKQRQFNLMENFDLSIGSVQQALSNSKQQRSAEPLRDISNEQQLPTRDLNLFFQRLDDGAYDKKTLIKIIAKLLDCAERTHSSYVESLVKKAKHLIVVEELEELIRLMAIVMIDKQKQLGECEYKHENTTQKIQRFVKTLQQQDTQFPQPQFSPQMVRSESCHELTEQDQRQAQLLIQKSLIEFQKLSSHLTNQFIA